MREVKVYNNRFDKEYAYTGVFLEFGIGQGVNGQETKAIIEKQDGTVDLVSLYLIKFVYRAGRYS